MDRTWRDDPERNGAAVLNDPNLSFWQKFTNGAYSYQAMSGRFMSNFENTKTKVTFIENLIENKNEFKEEEDRLLLKRAELAIFRKYNAFRAPFLAGAATVSLLALFNTKLGLMKRLAPTIISFSLIAIWGNNIGMYGVHREVDEVLMLMAGEDESEKQMKLADCEVRKLTKQFLKEQNM